MRALLSGAATLTLLSACAPAIVPLSTRVEPPADTTTVTLLPVDPVISAPAAVIIEPVISSSDVAREALAVFGDTIVRPVALVGALDEPDAATAEPSPVWDIDVRSFEGQARVEWWVKRLAVDWREGFGAQIRRGVPYDSMMRAKLRAGGLPEDMVYLALIESGFDPHAYSRAAAVGMWQFMSSTARDVGLRVDWWVDERRDPVRATDAAVMYLNDLRKQFGSLYLAAAAYNGGPTRIARGLSRYADDFEGTTGDSLFFALAEKDVLRAETKDYVPKLIAAALIAKEPERYGIRVSDMPSLAYDSVRVPGATPLAAIARASAVPLARIRELNPHILRGMIPRGAPMRVRLPVGAAAQFERGFPALDSEALETGRRIKSKKGETLASIARREKGSLTARSIGWYNPKLAMTKRGTLAAGQSIFVPTPAVVAAAYDVPDPRVERYPRRAGSTRTHVVKRGESLSVLARRYGTTVPALMKANHLRQPLIRAGQELLVRGTPKPTKIAKSAKSAPSKSAKRIKISKDGTGTRAKTPVRKKPTPSRSAKRSA